MLSHPDLVDLTKPILQTVFGTNDVKKLHQEIRKIMQGKLAHIDKFDNLANKEYQKMLDVQNQRLIDSGGQEIAGAAELHKIEQLKNYVEGYPILNVSVRPNLIKSSMDEIEGFIE